MRGAPVPEVHYARSGDVAIAYQLTGSGPPDLVFVPTFSNLVYPWWNAHFRGFYDQLGAFARLILLDKRGTGLSDRPRDLGTLETRIDDIRAVLDAAGSEKVSLFGTGEGGQICAFFAAMYPERTQALILYATPARAVRAPDYAFGPTLEQWHADLREVRERWGERDYFEQQARDTFGAAADDELVEWFVECQRFCASPGAAVAFYRSYGETDLRDVLSAIRVQTLVLYRAWNRDQSLDLAGRIPGAQALELSGDDRTIVIGDAPAEIERFIVAAPPDQLPDRVLTTVLFTDIVGSTEQALSLGDSAWTDLLARHRAAVRGELTRFHGTEVDTAGDGFFATFEGPARAILCAQEIVSGSQELGLAVRAGVHTGECEVRGEKVAGIAVHLGARVATEAAPGEVLVSRTVKDLVAGSGLEFEDRGIRSLKGVPEEWQLYAVR
ncbi:MAG: adenylate/guanylate cyclase domain-containing protein [Gaiellaceae bacterium]